MVHEIFLPARRGLANGFAGGHLRIGGARILQGISMKKITSRRIARAEESKTLKVSAFIAVVQEYLDKHLEMETCATCGKSKHARHARRTTGF
jgi:hypothetical protein